MLQQAKQYLYQNPKIHRIFHRTRFQAGLSSHPFLSKIMQTFLTVIKKYFWGIEDMNY